MGKGDTYRPVNRQKYEENYERIFPSCECGGKGYFEDIDFTGKVIKTACMFCCSNSQLTKEIKKRLK